MDKNRGKNAQKVIVAMSGGLDSSVAVALLKRAGFNVAGVFMKFWHESDSEGQANACCSPESEGRARKVAKILKIPFYVFNLEKEFKKKIVDCCVKEYEAGSTPNPCIICNKEIKFGLFLEKALKLGADYIATGHYARKQEAKKGKYKLLQAKDREKDQSYFLWKLSQRQLKKSLFPIGDYTREEVKKMARKFKLPVLRAEKSVEICFIKTTINEFLKKRLNIKPGEIFNIKGKPVGKHEGLWLYTIGQRKGLEIPGGPYYVLEKKPGKNRLIVTKKEKDLYKKELIIRNVNWVSGKEPRMPLRAEAKIRYRHDPASATIYHLKPLLSLKFRKSQKAITPGQSVVFYRGEELLGGGIIC